MTDSITIDGESALDGMPDELRDVPITSQTGLAAIALNFALKYHDINTVHDGTLYQQYKLEGRNFNNLHLDMVFDTAIQIEKHLLHTPSRLALMVLDTIAEDIEGALSDGPASGTETEGQDHEDGLGAEHEGPTAEGGDAQKESGNDQS